MERKTSHEQLVRKSVLETLASLGMEIDRPHEMQEDFAWLRRMRRAADDTHRRVRASVVTLVVTTVLLALWEMMRGG